MRFLPLLALPVALLIAAAGCASSPYGFDSKAAEIARRAGAAGLPPETVDTSARLFNMKCMRCHKAYDPAKYSERQWNTWMTKMTTKAKLTTEQSDVLSAYLNAARSQKHP